MTTPRILKFFRKSSEVPNEIHRFRDKLHKLIETDRADTLKKRAKIVADLRTYRVTGEMGPKFDPNLKSMLLAVDKVAATGNNAQFLELANAIISTYQGELVKPRPSGTLYNMLVELLEYFNARRVEALNGVEIAGFSIN